MLSQPPAPVIRCLRGSLALLRKASDSTTLVSVEPLDVGRGEHVGDERERRGRVWASASRSGSDGERSVDVGRSRGSHLAHRAVEQIGARRAGRCRRAIAAPAVTVKVRVWLPPASTEPTVHCTTLPDDAPPADAETNVVPGGMVAVRTPPALSGRLWFAVLLATIVYDDRIARLHRVVVLDHAEVQSLGGVHDQVTALRDTGHPG